eukprot:COSAG05_NODE_19931_length_285_cov_1.118280_1_plen_48_part_10
MRPVALHCICTVFFLLLMLLFLLLLLSGFFRGWDEIGASLSTTTHPPS